MGLSEHLHDCCSREGITRCKPFVLEQYHVVLTRQRNMGRILEAALLFIVSSHATVVNEVKFRNNRSLYNHDYPAERDELCEYGENIVD